MSTGAKKRETKRGQIRKLFDLLQQYDQIIAVQLDNVGSNQVQQIRKALDKKNAKLLIGKNTVTRKAIRLLTNTISVKDLDSQEDFNYYDSFPKKQQLEALSGIMRNQIGLIFTDTPVHELKEVIQNNRVSAVARPGILAPVSVSVPPGPTGLDPSQIGFFHALHITTKIQKGQIEILNEVTVCTAGTIVMHSQAALLEKLNIKPFSYGMEIKSIYDNGSILTPEQALIDPQTILQLFSKGVSNLTGLSLGLGFANELSAPHLVTNAFKNLLALSLGSDYKLPILDTLAQACQGQASVADIKQDKKEVIKAPIQEEEEEEEEMGLGDLF